MRAKISLRAIGAMPTNSIIWDTEIRGLNVRRQSSDVVTYSIVYRTLDGIQRWQRIGRHGVWTPDLARKQARSVLMARDLGKDPSADKMVLRSAPTMDQLCDEYVADMQSGKKPALGKRKVASVTQEDVEQFMHGLSLGSARRITGLLGAIFSYSIKRKLRETNPVHGLDKPADTKRMRRLSDAEYAQLWSALENGDNAASDVFRLLIVSGWRSGEANNLRWSEVDLERKIATLGDTKTGLSIRPLIP
jgi:integrase